MIGAQRYPNMSSNLPPVDARERVFAAANQIFDVSARQTMPTGDQGGRLAKVGMDVFNRAIADSQPPFFIQIGLYPPVLAFAIAVAVVATLFSGLIPAVQASRPDIAEVLKERKLGGTVKSVVTHA